MVRFPETAETEWIIVAEAAKAEADVRAKIERDTKVETELERLRVRHEATEALRRELDADSTPQLEMMTLATYNATPNTGPTDMIDGVMKENGLCIFLGPSGSGKSTLVLQMVYSLLTGNKWLDQNVAKINGAAGILSYDMDGVLVMDWLSMYPNIDPTKLSVVNAHKRGNPLGVPAIRSQIVEAWQRMNVEVVVLDSFGASFFGHDQNDAATTTAHYRDLLKFALTEVGAKALIVLSHSTEGATHKARGSTAQHDVADTIVALEGTGVEPRKVRMIKYRQHKDPTTGSLTHMMNPVVVTAPDPVTHLVDLDYGTMTLEGMNLPPSAGAAMFPDTYEEPDTDSEDEEDYDL